MWKPQDDRTGCRAKEEIQLHNQLSQINSYQEYCNDDFSPLTLGLILPLANSTCSLEALQRQVSHRHNRVFKTSLAGTPSFLTLRMFVIEKEVFHPHTVTTQHKYNGQNLILL